MSDKFAGMWPSQQEAVMAQNKRIAELEADDKMVNAVVDDLSARLDAAIARAEKAEAALSNLYGQVMQAKECDVYNNSPSMNRALDEAVDALREDG